MKTKGLIVVALVLGLINTVLTMLFGVSSSPAHSVIKIVIIVAALVVAWLAGMAAKRQGGKPLWLGALAGAVYGLVSSLGTFFVHITAADLKNAAQLNAQEVAAAVHVANSTTVHIVDVIMNIVVYGVLGLIVGIIGGATAKRKEKPEDS